MNTRESTRSETSTGFKSYGEFWPYYVGEHALGRTRLLHFVGTTLGAVTIVAALAAGRYWLLLLAPVVAYGCAWVGHFFVEHNKPATFRHPLWSLRGDFQMYGLMLRGRMGQEARRVREAQGEPPRHST